MKRAMLVLTAAALLGGASSVLAPVGAQEPPPQTGFEARNGDSWTTHQEELAFLAEVDERSGRVEMEVVGTTLQGRPLHLVRLGHPVPRGVQAARGEPTTIFVCTQHGNEPAGREACLQALRDLAFTEDPGLVDLLSSQTFLFIPTANPDGRQANSRGNSQGVDVNRDHMALRTREAQAISAVVRDWAPELSMDMHEYGPGVPVLYDDDILYLWPRNLNVERLVHDHARSFAEDHIRPCSEEGGYTADEYGLYKAADVEVQQVAGDHDEAIMRNAMGLRHSLGILIESAVSSSSGNLVGETLSGSENRLRRVGSQRHVIDCSLEWMAENGPTVMEATTTAPLRKQGEGMAQNVPIYFGGADNQPPTPAQTVYPPVCAYDLTAAEHAQHADTLGLHGIETVELENGSVRVPMAQPAEPLIPLLLDSRGSRRIASAARVMAPPLAAACSLPAEEGGGSGVPMAMAGVAALAGVGFRLRRP